MEAPKETDDDDTIWRCWFLTPTHPRSYANALIYGQVRHAVPESMEPYRMTYARSEGDYSPGSNSTSGCGRLFDEEEDRHDKVNMGLEY